MSFRCWYTGKVAPSGTRAVKVIVESRRKEYLFRPKAIPVKRKGRKKKAWRDDKGGFGFERVKEVMMTPEGARLYFESEEGQRMKALLEGGYRQQAMEEAEARRIAMAQAEVDGDDDSYTQDSYDSN
jgi:hypothetical protein